MKPAHRWLRETISEFVGVVATNKLLWSPDLPIVYVDNPKCGSSTIKNSLKQAQAGIYVRAGRRYQRAPDPHKADDCLRTRGLSVGACKRRVLISCVRNPFTRALSAYLDKISTRTNLTVYPELEGRPLGSFELFLEAVSEYPSRRLNYHLRPQHMNLDYPNIAYDAIFFMENISCLSDYLREVSDEFALETYAPHSRSAKSYLDRYYTPAAVDLVKSIYAKDFELFAYSRQLANSDAAPGKCIIDRKLASGENAEVIVPRRHPVHLGCRPFAATVRYHQVIDMFRL